MSKTKLMFIIISFLMSGYSVLQNNEEKCKNMHQISKVMYHNLRYCLWEHHTSEVLNLHAPDFGGSFFIEGGFDLYLVCLKTHDKAVNNQPQYNFDAVMNLLVQFTVKTKIYYFSE